MEARVSVMLARARLVVLRFGGIFLLGVCMTLIVCYPFLEHYRIQDCAKRMASSDVKVDGPPAVLAPSDVMDERFATMSPPSDVMLLSYMRSGSTYLGRSLTGKTDAFYFYEPLRQFSVWGYFTNSTLVCVRPDGGCDRDMRKAPALEDVYNVLENFYRCNITDDFARFIKDPISVSAWKDCKQEGLAKCLPRKLQQCRTAKHRVTKVLRITVDLARRMLVRLPNLKLVHLVRDPRGIINSRINTGFFKYLQSSSNATIIRHSARNLCEKMEHDVAWSGRLHEEFPDRVKIIQYEDVLERQDCLLEYVGMEVPRSFGDIKANNSMKWRDQLPWKSVHIIDEECSRVYENLGYLKFPNKNAFEDEATPLMLPELPYRCS